MADLQKPDIVTVLPAGLALTRKGKHLWACCPLHGEKTASFKVDSERNRFHCFGCGAGGDSVEFVKLYHKTDFVGALRILGIAEGKPPKHDPLRMKKDESYKIYRLIMSVYENLLLAKLRILNRLRAEAKTIGDVEKIAPLYYEEQEIICQLDVLQLGTELERFDLYKEVFCD
ncbi:MAG: CHC2 zinc finger domain-containing protein [Nitrospirae bacterium YQR-1]